MRIFSFVTAAAALGVAAFSPLAAEDLPILFSPQSVYAYNQVKTSISRLYLPLAHPGVIRFSPSSKWTNVQKVELSLSLPEKLSVRLFAEPLHSSTTKEVHPESSVSAGVRTFRFELNAMAWKRGAQHSLYIEGHDRSADGASLVFDLCADGRPAGRHEFKIQTVALPQIRKPKDFKIFTYYARGAELPDAALAERNVLFLEELGLSGILSARNFSHPGCAETFRMLNRRNWWLGREIGGENEFARLGIQYTPERATRNGNGEIVKPRYPEFWVSFCPQFLIEELPKHPPREWNTFPGIKLNGIYLDFEMYNHVRMLSICKCRRCLEAFAGFAGIPAEKLNASDVEKSHPERWLAFREKQLSEMVRAYIENYRVNGKRPEFVFNSFFQVPKNSFAIVKNSYYEKFTDYIMPMIYLRGAIFFDRVKFNADSTSGKFMPMLYSVAGSIIADWNLPEEIALDLVASAACGSEGAAYFCDVNFDGRYAEKIRLALDAIARCEEFNRKGRQVEDEVKIIDNSVRTLLEIDGKTVPSAVKNLNNLRHIVRRQNDRYLVQLFNFDGGSPVEIRIVLPKTTAKFYRVTDQLTDKRYIPGGVEIWSAEQLQRGIPMKIGTRDFSAVRIEPVTDVKAEKPADGTFIILRERPADAPAEVLEKRLDGNGMAISRTDRTGHGQTAVKIETPELTAWIDLADSGRIEQLLDKKTGKNLLREPGLGLFRERFDEPVASKIEAIYQVVERKILPDRAVVELAATLLHGQLNHFKISKRYTVFRNQPKINVWYRITVNRDEKSRSDFRIRIQNQPDFGLSGNNLNDLLKFCVVSGGKSQELSGRGHLAFGKADGIFSGYLSRTIKGGFDRQEFTVSAQNGYHLKFYCSTPGIVAQLLSWRSEVPTAEIFLVKTDFSPDPHRSKILDFEVGCELNRAK